MTDKRTRPGRDDLLDADLAHEIDLVGDLVLAASESEGPLSAQEIDHALGIDEGGPGERRPG
ncbi:MAG: hypothetical protein LWW86_01680 [Micrococcales bacterium]|nr:hypothetical protein [Micrococcales bacterium]